MGGRVVAWSQKLGLVALSTLVCFGVLEVGFRIAGYRPIYQTYSKPELFWRHDDLLGWSLRPGSKGTYVGPRPFPVEFRAPVRINSLGLRGAEVADLPAGGRRVMVLGDSLVAGFEVAEDKTYTSLLETRMSADLGTPVQVINAGVRGYGTDQTYLYYRERGRRLHPDLVVFHATANDPEDNTTLHRARRPFGKPAFAMEAEGSLHVVGRPVPRYPFCSAYRLDARFRVVRIDGTRSRMFCWAQTRLADHSALLTFATSRLERNPTLMRRIYGLGTPDEQAAPVAPATTAPTASQAPATTAATSAAPPPAAAPASYEHRLTSVLITRLADEVRRDGARFVLLAEEADLRPLDQAALSRDGVEVVTADAAEPADQSWHFRNDRHFNEKGHRLLAEHLAPPLEADLRR